MNKEAREEKKISEKDKVRPSVGSLSDARTAAMEGSNESVSFNMEKICLGGKVCSFLKNKIKNLCTVSFLE